MLKQAMRRVGAEPCARRHAPMINSNAACCQFVVARRDHKERKEDVKLRLICLFFVCSPTPACGLCGWMCATFGIPRRSAVLFGLPSQVCYNDSTQQTWSLCPSLARAWHAPSWRWYAGSHMLTGLTACIEPCSQTDARPATAVRGALTRAVGGCFVFQASVTRQGISCPTGYTAAAAPALTTMACCCSIG